MKKLFTNVNGNQFQLLKESIDNGLDKTTLVREGLKKVFSAGSPELSYRRVEGVGMGYIKSVSEATKTAIQEARQIAAEYGYMDNPDQAKFVKEIDTNPEGDMAHPEANTGNPEADMSAPKESREVQIALEIKKLIAKLVPSENLAKSEHAIIDLCNELIKLHGKQ